MKLFTWMKDGGPESRVSGFWLIEFKPLFSIALLKFEDGSRAAYHTHAFNSVSWLLKGTLIEDILNGHVRVYGSGPIPIITKRNTFHKVTSLGTSWVLTFRGPWSKTWKEYLPITDKLIRLTNGRKELA